MPDGGGGPEDRDRGLPWLLGLVMSPLLLLRLPLQPLSPPLGPCGVAAAEPPPLVFCVVPFVGAETSPVPSVLTAAPRRTCARRFATRCRDSLLNRE